MSCKSVVVAHVSCRKEVIVRTSHVGQPLYLEVGVDRQSNIANSEQIIHLTKRILPPRSKENLLGESLKQGSSR